MNTQYYSGTYYGSTICKRKYKECVVYKILVSRKRFAQIFINIIITYIEALNIKIYSVYIISKTALQGYNKQV